MSKINNKITLKLFELVDQPKYALADLEKIKSLLLKGADPNFREENYPNQTVLYRVLSSWEEKNRLEIVKLLLEYGVDLNLMSDIFYPISLATSNNDIFLVQFMLENGADKGLYQALKTAIEKDNIDLVRLLLKHDLNVEPHSESYMIFCCEAYRTRDRKIEYEIQPGIKIASMLIDHGINPNGIDGDSTPLLEAIRFDFYELINLLLDNGAIIKEGISASFYANNIEMLQFLFEKGIIKNWNEINISSEETPIIYHTIQSNYDIIKYLIDNGADLYHKNKHQKTAFHYALYNGNTSFIDYLLKYYDVKKCHEISSVFECVDDKKIRNKLKVILD